jgi:SNARE protein 1
VLVLDEMDAKRAEIAVVQAPVDWNGQAKQTLNPSCYLDKAALNPVKVSPSQEVMSQMLRRRLWGKDGSAKQSSEIGRVDAATLAVVQKHRELQEGLTDEMVVLAAQLKDSSMLMDVSLQDTEDVLGSAEAALEHTLASTDHVNMRAGRLYSQSWQTNCLT